jgi:hypothetical protein
MSNGRELDGPGTYEIRVFGRLDHQWSGWLGKFVITQAGEHTLLRGTVVDQAALYGILLKIHNLGLLMLSVERCRLDMETMTKEVHGRRPTGEK